MHRVILSLHKVQKRQKAKRNKTPHDNPISSLLRTDPPNQTIQSRHLACRPRNPAINTSQRFPLQSKTLINRIRLAQHIIRHIMTIFNPTPFS